jgi:hypothetical protein
MEVTWPVITRSQESAVNPYLAAHGETHRASNISNVDDEEINLSLVCSSAR